MIGQRPSSRPSSVVEYYDQVAENWDQSHGSGRQNPRFARQLRHHLVAMLTDLPDNARGLEIGAGTGPYIEVTAPLLGHLTATDISEGMLRVMQRRITALNLSNVTVMRADACDLGNIDAGSMDAVYSIGLLETVPDLARVFAAIHHVLKPGGFVAGITSNGNCPWYIVRRWFEGGERHGRTGQLVTATRLHDVVRRAGFGPPEIIYWGALPPGTQNRLLGATFAALETLVTPTPLARYLGVLSFQSWKPGVPA